MSDEVTNYAAALKACEAVLSRLEGEKRRKIEEATRKIHDEMRDAIRQASITKQDAKMAYEGALIRAKETNPLIGKKVMRKTYPTISRWSSKTKEVIEYGIIEIRTHETNFPANVRYSIPYIGDIFVRLLKKDGTPGLAFERHVGQWEPVEEQTAA